MARVQLLEEESILNDVQETRQNDAFPLANGRVDARAQQVPDESVLDGAVLALFGDEDELREDDLVGLQEVCEALPKGKA